MSQAGTISTAGYGSIRVGRPRAAASMLFAHTALIVVAVCAIQFQLWTGASHADLLGEASVLVLLTSAWMLISYRVAAGTVFDPYGLFVMAAIPFHAGYSILRLFGRDAPLRLTSEVPDALLAETLLLVAASFAGLHLGALGVRVWGTYVGAKAPANPADVVRDSDLRWVGAALLLLVAVPTLLELKGYLDIVMSGGYTELFLERQRITGPSAGGTLVDLATPFFVPAVMFLLAGSRDSFLGRWTATIVLLLYALVYLFIGFRAYAIIPVVVLFWVWHAAIRPLPLRLLSVLGAGFFLFLAPLVRTFRGLSGSDRLSPEAILSAYFSVENPVFRLIGELAGSMYTISYTAVLVPSVRTYEWGMGYVRAVLNAVPVIDLPAPYGDSGVWLAWEIRPDWAAGGFAYGYSFIAEAFLNFGWLGAPLVLILLGAGIVALGRWALQAPDRSRLAFVAAFLPVLLFFVRGESINLSRPIFWYALIPFAAAHLLRRYRERVGG